MNFPAPPNVDALAKEDQILSEYSNERLWMRLCALLGTLCIVGGFVLLTVAAIEFGHARARIAELEAQLKECKP